MGMLLICCAEVPSPPRKSLTCHPPWPRFAYPHEHALATNPTLPTSRLERIRRTGKICTVQRARKPVTWHSSSPFLARDFLPTRVYVTVYLSPAPRHPIVKPSSLDLSFLCHRRGELGSPWYKTADHGGAAVGVGWVLMDFDPGPAVCLRTKSSIASYAAGLRLGCASLTAWSLISFALWHL